MLLGLNARGQARLRELARAKQAEAKQALAERRRLDEEVNKLERRLESIEREFRKLLGVVRLKPLGRDRFYNRVWWFDGCGTSSLLGSGGAVQYGTGRIFIQGPSEFDQEILNRREAEDGIVARRMEEEGEEGMLKSHEWAVYTELDEVSHCLVIGGSLRFANVWLDGRICRVAESQGQQGARIEEYID